VSNFLHLVKYNLIFQKTRIAFLSVFVVFMVFVVDYFMDTRQEFGEAIMQYSSYVLFVLFTGKMNAKNSQMFDIKHLLAMPLTKKEIIFSKSVADIVQISPVCISFLWGFHIKFPDYHLPMVIVIFILLMTVMNIIAFIKRIDFFRMQHSKSHFRNMFLFAHKYLELMIVILFVAIAVGLVLAVFGKNNLMMEYSFAVLLIVAIFMSTMNALKMLKDETLSYFLYKRDIFRIGWKLVLLIGPGMMFHWAYKGKLQDNGFVNVPDSLAEPLQKISNIESQRFMLSILTKDEDYLKNYLNEKKPIPWDTEVRGMYPVHAAVFGNQLELLSEMIKLRPEVVNKPGAEMNSTPLFVAMKQCHIEAADLLIQAGAKVDHKNKDGETALMYAAKFGCAGGVMQMIDAGANPFLKNKKNVSAYALIESKKNGVFDYLVKKEVLPAQKPLAKRSLASEKSKRPEAPKVPHE